jgi:hypothetical protein
MRVAWLVAGISCAFAGITLIVAAWSVFDNPLPRIPPENRATPIWHGGHLASAELYATWAVSSSVPTAVPIPPRLGRIDVIYRPMEPEYWIGKERPTQLQDPCHGPLRGATCRPLFASVPGPMTGK